MITVPRVPGSCGAVHRYSCYPLCVCETCAGFARGRPHRTEGLLAIHERLERRLRGIVFSLLNEPRRGKRCAASAVQRKRRGDGEGLSGHVSSLPIRILRIPIGIGIEHTAIALPVYGSLADEILRIELGVIGSISITNRQ